MQRSLFARVLYETGYLEGRNVAIELRSTEQYGELPALATELVRLRVAVIAALGGFAASAAKKATTAIPIVFSIGGDPVELGLVASLNQDCCRLYFATICASRRPCDVWREPDGLLPTGGRLCRAHPQR